MAQNELQDILMKIGQHYNLIETSGDVRQLEGELKQLDKRLDEASKRIDDQWKAMRLWIMIISLILGGLNITILIVTLSV